ncbi:MAG: DUF5312 domain-containing protein [Spirochaetales bacterium]
MASIFDHLVSELTSEERKHLLERIQNLHPLSQEPMVSVQEEEEVDFEKEYRALGFLERILLWIRAFFTRKVREEILEEYLVKKLGKDFQRKAPGILDLKHRLLLPTFAERVEQLKAPLSVLGSFLSSLSGSRRNQFIAFLGAFEMEPTMERLSTELDPLYLIALKWYNLDPPFSPDSLSTLEIPSPEQLTDAELRRILDNRLEDILAGISQEEKNRMYMDVRFLDRLSRLVYFPLDRILSTFRAVSDLPYTPCPFQRIQEQVVQFTEALYALQDPVPPVLLEALVVFKLGRDVNDLDGEDEARSISRALAQMEEAIQAVRTFMQKLPLLTLVKVLTGRINYRCPEQGGGEDWFNQFRQHWRGKVDETFRSFLEIRRKDELGREMNALLSPATIPLPDGKSFRDCPIHLLGLLFLRTFFQTLFVGRYNRPLRIILVEGLFYKEENRKEYTDAFGVLLKLEEELEPLVLPDSWESLPQEQRKSLESRVLLWSEQFRDSIQSLERILDGILFGEAGGRYDTLSNLGSVGGRGNAQLLQSLQEVLKGLTTIGPIAERLILLQKKQS